MVADKVRMDAFRRSLAATVKPGGVVLDIGCGQGIMSMIACELGAARVYAIEPSDVIAVARDCARINGVGERIHFLQEVSQKVELPERVDVIVSDMRGVLPIYSTHFESIIDARSRFLKPDGKLIPARDTVQTSLVDAKKDREERLKGYTREAAGFDFSPAIHVATNELWKVEAKPEQMRSEPATLFTLDYPTLKSTDLHATVTLEVTRGGSVDGLLLWFETDLFDGIGYSTGPLCPLTIYGQGVLPWPEALELQAGDIVEAEITVKQVGEDPFWRWQTKVRRGATLLREMDQSLLPALMLSKNKLQKALAK